MLFLLSGHHLLHDWVRAAYIGQDSCLPYIMRPLRVPPPSSGRWRPTRALGIQRWSHHYGKVCKHMVLNRDVQRFSLDVPPTCRIWLKCNEVLVRQGSWSNSHYCLVIGCQAADAHWDAFPVCHSDVVKYDCRWMNTWKISPSLSMLNTPSTDYVSSCFFHISYFLIHSMVFRGLGQCCYALLHLLKAAWCNIKLSNIPSIQKAGKLAHESVLVMAIRRVSPTQTKVTAETFIVISINSKSSRQESLLFRSNSPRNQEKYISWIQNCIPLSSSLSLFEAACRLLYFLTSRAYSLCHGVVAGFFLI